MIQIGDIRDARARLAPHVLRTPTRRSEWLSRPGADVHLKLEVVQPTSSYKIRGAFNAALQVRRQRLVTASAGNHGRAMAYAARALNLPLTVFIAATAPAAKIAPIRASGADVRTCRDYDEAERAAKEYAAGGNGLFISPYSHPDVIAGAGTIGLELIEDVRQLDAVVVPIGGGGLISGIAIAIKAVSPGTRVIGVEVAASCPFTKSLAAGRLVTIDVQPSLADGLTGNLDPDTITFDIVRALVDELAVVGEADLRGALAGIAEHEHLVIEGAAAAGPAALLSGTIEPKGNVAVVLTGANIDTRTFLDVCRRSASE